MPVNFDYSVTAKNFANRHPFLSFFMTQIAFWVAAEMLLGILINIFLSAVSEAFQLPFKINFFNNITIGIMLGLLCGLLLGLLDYVFEAQYFRRKSLGIIYLMKVVFSFIVFMSLFGLVRFFLFEKLIKPFFPESGPLFNEQFWKYWFYLFTVYNFTMVLIITFINQVNKKYGPGVLIPLLLGKYRNPKEEERIFMFMDLKSSTTIAEKLGHLKYSSFIRDSFMDINLLLNKFNAEIYQYVGDEIVIIWTLNNGLKDMKCIKFFFACDEQFRNRSSYYLENYESLPQFKAGIHMGKITTVEIGEIKRDIAYHGDTINTTARIQSICNEYNKNLLVSKFLFDNIENGEFFKIESLGMIQLKGKQNALEIISIEGF